MNRLLDYLRRVLEEPLADADLLERFIQRRDETAFAALLKRHGPMVLGVCQRILGNSHDAEDAFQATFLVLARRASSVRPRETVGNWLYGVAFRTAMQARSKIKRRYAREKQVNEMPEPEESQPSCCHDLLSLLDRELQRLPDKYRLPVVLCDLEGRSRKEVARRLAIPEGTLSSRLATAHKKLAWRLTRFGLSVSGASLALLMAENAASACVPASLLVATTKAGMLLALGEAAGVSATIISLAEGVMRTMFIAKLKTATVLLCGVAALSIGTGGLWYQTHVGAADSPRPGKSRVAEQEVNTSRVNRDDEVSRPQKEKAKLAAEEERLRASLREQLEMARREAESQRDRAEAERRRAEEALRALKEQLAKAKKEESQARQQVEKALYAQNIRQAQQETSPKPEAQQQTLKLLVEKEAKYRQDFEQKRQDLMALLKKLEAEERETLRKFQTERRSVEKQQAQERETLRKSETERNRLVKQRAEDRESPAGDKLDRILERLERMERRLERPERGERK